MNKKSIVIVTGVSFREAKKIFPNTDLSCLLDYQGKKIKINAAAGAAIELNKKGHLVYMIGASKEKMEIIGKLAMKNPYFLSQTDLLDKKELSNLTKEVNKIRRKVNLDVYIVHYGGASEVNVNLPNDTIFLNPWETPSEAIAPLIEYNCTTCLNIIQAFKSIIKSQKKTKIVIISAVASQRTARLHLLDAIQKAAIHAMARTLALDLTKENIFITEVMPGITDTGFYDTKGTREAVEISSKEYGYEINSSNFPLMPAKRVGEAVLFAIETDAHVREISLIPEGQWPHLGA